MGARRLVTGHDSEGRAIFAGDEVVAPIHLDLVPGTEFHRLWGADQPPRFPDDEAATVVIQYTSSALNGGLAGRDILVDVRVKPQTAGNVVQLRPLQGFGQGPFEVAVTITNGVTDLSGNNIIRQLDFIFTTEEDPTADSFAQVNETFDTNTFEDTNFTSNPGNLSGDNTFATWNSKAQPGALVTSVDPRCSPVVGSAMSDGWRKTTTGRLCSRICADVGRRHAAWVVPSV